jgi:beta-N-acetylhexosaminidase
MPGKRLTAALAVLACVCALPPLAGAASAPPADLSARQIAGLRIVTGFSGRTVPAQLREMITAGDVAGVILFSANVGSAVDVQSLTRQLQAVPRPAGVDEPLLVMSDQEGGLVRRLPGQPKVSAKVASRKGPAFAEQLGRSAGGSMSAMGVNVNLAPVLDIGRAGRAIDNEQRTWGRTAAAVKRTAIPFSRGLQSAGVGATAKHFPGLGLAKVNTDDKVQKIRGSRAKLRKSEMAPFASFIGAGGKLIMLGTAIYPSLSPRPAALARPIATGELRNRLKFTGVSITDALDTASGRAFGGPAKLALAATTAGTDLILFGDIAQARAGGLALRQALESGAATYEGYEASAARILALRAGFALK